MIFLIDSFNGVFISKHRNIKNALKAKEKHTKAIKKANGKDSYLTYSIKDSSGKEVCSFNS